MNSNIEIPEGEMMFYSTKQCWNCGYDLERDEHDRVGGKWWLRTGCPVCCYSFVE